MGCRNFLMGSKIGHFLSTGHNMYYRNLARASHSLEKLEEKLFKLTYLKSRTSFFFQSSFLAKVKPTKNNMNSSFASFMATRNNCEIDFFFPLSRGNYTLANCEWTRWFDRKYVNPLPAAYCCLVDNPKQKRFLVWQLVENLAGMIEKSKDYFVLIFKQRFSTFW